MACEWPAGYYAHCSAPDGCIGSLRRTLDTDPFQMRNRIHHAESAAIPTDLDGWLDRKLAATGDQFLPGVEHMKRWNYPMDESGTVAYEL